MKQLLNVFAVMFWGLLASFVIAWMLYLLAQAFLAGMAGVG
jgi:hypothetical protein